MTPIEGVATAVTAFVGAFRDGPLGTPRLLGDFLEFEKVFGGLWTGSDLPFAIRDFFENGGTQAVVVRLPEKASAADLAALDEVSFNLLCLPEGLSMEPAAGYCEQRGALLLADVVDPAVALPASSHVAVYYPRLVMPSPFDGNRPRGFRALGAIAGMMARLDRTRGVWKAPAGMDATLRGASGVEQVLPAPQIEVLTQRGINVLRSIRAEASVVWGARTLSAQAEWKYVNVRRLSLYLQASLQQGLAWAAFEPNSEPLWRRVRESVDEFLRRHWQKGALLGDRPQQAYFVKCDATTMTANDIAQGRLICQVGFAPLRAAEFLILRIQLPTAV